MPLELTLPVDANLTAAGLAVLLWGLRGCPLPSQITVISEVIGGRMIG